MTDPTLHHLDCPSPDGRRRMAWWQWGRADAPHVVLCVHGLTRQGRDFDTLAQALLARRPDDLRVVCPDIAGRGQSDWLPDPAAYQAATYVADLRRLIEVLRPATLDWVGTSMGGVLGMVLAQQVPLRRLVLNDVGPAIEWQGVQRIAGFLGQVAHFDSLEQAAAQLWQVSTGYGAHTREQWLRHSQAMVKPDPTGAFSLHYDPAIAIPFRAITPERAARDEARLWQLYDHTRAETLVLRGAQSDLLSAATAHAMTQRGPRARLVSFEGVGHAPTLIAPEQVRAVTDFLLGDL